MVVGKEGIFPRSINMRISEMLAILNGGAGGFLCNGDIITVSASAVAPVIGSNGIFTRISTATNAYVSGELQYNRQREPAFHCRFELSSSSSVQLFIGFSDRSPGFMTVGSLPSGDYCGLYLGSGDSTWKFVHSQGGSGTEVDEGTSVDSNDHDFYMWLKKSGGGNSVIFQLDNGERFEVTSNIPSSSAIMRQTCELRRLASTKSLDIAKVTVIQEA